MSNKVEKNDERISNFAEKYKLWLLIPLGVSGILAVSNIGAGISMLVFIASLWLFTEIVGKVLSIVEGFLPDRLSPEGQKAFQESSRATLFLGGMAAIGSVLRGDNFLSNFVLQYIPEGVSFSFIDPIFAVIVLIFIWIYTALQIKH